MRLWLLRAEPDRGSARRRPGATKPSSAPLEFGDTITHSGYVVQLEGTPFLAAPASCNGLAMGESARGFKAAADPLEPSNTRFFATNANITIVEDTASLWATMPEAGDAPSGHPLR